ncbi:MAG TPA: NAD(P)-dependent oxidoreductase [Stellaceae bacterium]|nr:NAD(P)-dependent oxidoreductase [Stellaceae bacterium]
MFPIVLDLAQARVALVGNGKAALRRLALLDADAARHVAIYADDPLPELAAAAGKRLHRRLPSAGDLAGIHIVFAVDLAPDRLAALSATARAAGALVNIEDQPAFSSFHSPSVLRRGDLLIAVSTNGQSPGLARRVRRFLEGLFGAEWQARLDDLAALRQSWREAGAGSGEIAGWTDAWIDRHHWLDEAWLDEGGEAAAHFAAPSKRGERVMSNV